MPSGNSVSIRRAVLIVFAAATASVVLAGENPWPKNSASDMAIHVTLLRFQIYADRCSARVPLLKPEFEGLMENLTGRIQRLSRDLLATDEFRDMQDKPVPVEVLDAFKDSFEDMKHNFERQDATSICPTTLRSVGELDDDSLKSSLTLALTAIQNMIGNLDTAPAGQASPDTAL